MENQDNIEQTIRILESIVERANSIHDNPNRELCLDIDLMLEDLRVLYRRYEILKRQCENTHGSETMNEEVADHKPQHEEPSSIPVENTLLKEETPVDTTSASGGQYLPEAPQEIEPETAASSTSPSRSDPERQTDEPRDFTTDNRQEHQPRVERSNTGAVKGNNGKSVIDLFSQDTIPSIGDQFGQDDNSLHQRISRQKEDRSIGTRLQQNAVDNIKDAIGLNEKFLFINELFNGDIQAYNEAIAKLNSMGSLQQAFDYLNELAHIQHLDTKRSAETLEKLAGFVQRRYLNS